MLRGVPKACADTDEVATCSIIDRLGVFEVPGESCRPRNQIGQISVFGRQIEGTIGTIGPTGPSLEEELASVFRNCRVMHHCASYRNECVLQGGAAGRQHIRVTMPKPYDI